MGRRIRIISAFTVAALASSAWISNTQAAEGSAAEKKARARRTVDLPAESCDGLLIGEMPITQFDAKLEERPIDDLLVADPARNLAVQHPTIVMNVAQKIWHAIKRYPSRKIADPTYPVWRYRYYPAFSDGVVEAGGSSIIGQFDAIERVAGYVSDQAAGKGHGDMLMLVGPAGTGKTEYLNIIVRLLDKLSLTDPDFYEYTFKWVGLEQIPSLAYLVADDAGTMILHPLKRSPLVLLPPEAQANVVALATPTVQKRLGYNPIPVLQPDAQTRTILDSLVSYYRTKWNLATIDSASYLRILRQHVRIVRRVPDPDQPPAIVRYQGKNPDPSALFFRENIGLLQVYGSGSPLSYDYNGVLPRADGRPTLIDEAFRQAKDLRDTLLEFAQNGVLDAGGAPPLWVDSLSILATNDESVTEAREEGGSKAHLDRLIKQPMRQPIHPALTAKTALFMSARKSFSSLYKMRKLDGTEMVPANLSELYPAPTERGELATPDGRYAVYHTPSPDTEILIAPHTLELLGLTVGGTRLVTDPKALQKFVHELNVIGPAHHYFTSVKSRMEIITRRIQVQSAVLADLRKLMFELREGQDGISARDAERWLRRALELAQQHGGTLTPVILDLAFKDLMMKGDFLDNKSDLRARWVMIHGVMKSDFILPALTSDIQSIIGGESGLVDKIYEEMKKEIIELSSDQEAKFWFDEGGEKHPINMSRLTEIRRIYKQINGEEFTPGKVKPFAMNPTGGERFMPLMRAIEHYLLNKELDTAAMTELLDFFDGKAVSEEVRNQGRQAEASLDRFGYNKVAFKEALRFVRDQQFELKRRQGVE